MTNSNPDFQNPALTDKPTEKLNAEPTSDMNPIFPPRILFVCLGNICRSPTAEAVFKMRARREGLEVEVDSAGTSAWHIGETPDPRSVETGEAQGYSFEGQRARQVKKNDFILFDKIIAMDKNNYEALLTRAPEPYQSKVEMFLTYTPNQKGQDVPDPYYGAGDGFSKVLKLVERASDGLIAALKSREEKPKP